MKIRWIGGVALAAALALGACAPTQQGADETSEASNAARTADPAHSMDMSSPGASEGDPGGGDVDDYDY